MTQTQKEAASRLTQLRNLQLAEQGKAQCHFCKRIFDGPDVMIIIAFGTPWLAGCRDCLGRIPLLIERRGDSLYFGPLRPEDRPGELVVAKNMAEARPFVDEFKPTFKKKEL